MRDEKSEEALRSHVGPHLFRGFVFHSVFSAICVLMVFSAVIRHSARLWGYNHCRVQSSHVMSYVMSAQEPSALGSMSPVGSDL